MRYTTTLLSLTTLIASTAWGSGLFPQRIEVFDHKFDKLGEYRYVYRIFFDLCEERGFI